MLRRASSFLQPILPFAVVLLIWQAASSLVQFSRGVDFPGPWQTTLRLLDLVGGAPLSDHSLLVHIAESLRRWLLGFSIAAFLGLVHGLLAGRYRAWKTATARIPQLLLLVPGLAWVPVAILLFGIGEGATIFMIAVTAFAPVAINTHSGIKGVDPQLVRAARMLGAGTTTLFLRVLIPAALPALLSGLRIGLGTGWRVLVAAEMVVGTGTGLGYSIIQARWTLDYTSSFACIAVICAIGLLIDQALLKQVEKKTIERWGEGREVQ